MTPDSDDDRTHAERVEAGRRVGRGRRGVDRRNELCVLSEGTMSESEGGGRYRRECNQCSWFYESPRLSEVEERGYLHHIGRGHDTYRTEPKARSLHTDSDHP